MNLRQLRYFLAVADTLHFGRAAIALNMAQPPLSAQIKQLETDLGVLLFERTKRRVQLTAAGEVLQKEARQVLAQLELARQKTQQAGRGELGQLSIAFVSSAMYSVLPPWLRQFRQRYPQVELTLQEATGVEQVEGLLSGRLDMGFVRPPIHHHPSLDSQSVWQEPLLLALPEGHALSAQAKVSIHDLADEHFILILRPLAMEMHDNIIGFCAQAGFSPQVVQTAAQLQTVLGLVAAQIGVAILPAAAQKLRREGVCYRPFIERTPMVELRVIWRKGDVSMILQNFLAASVSDQTD
jgi:DNA-binding transcriptional LysR family regulator